MTNHTTPHLFSYGRAFVAYCLAVTTATFTFILIEGPVIPVEQMLFVFLVGGLITFIESVVPSAIAIVVARRFSIMRWWYFAGSGVLIAALICIRRARLYQEGGLFGPTPDPIPSFAEAYMHDAFSAWLSGAIAGVVCWWFLRRGCRHG